MQCEKKIEKSGVQNFFGKATSCKKGKFLKYDKLELTDYLLPDWEITVKEKQEMFAIRPEMNDFPGNFDIKTDYEMVCKQLLNSQHTV